MAKKKLTPEQIETIEEIINKTYGVAEVKIEHSEPVVIEVRRKLVKNAGHDQ